ncbi:MAG: SUMF1/EgtB/PvdO family nonheme iron enzyme [Verrucomicrobia bacterium]|nr:SUMF1/EgtB/PvdO family nonheme iron enzyme [Verrucomicrobiota bacterium]
MRQTPVVIIALALVGMASPSNSQTVSLPDVAEMQAKYDERVGAEVLRPHEAAVADLNAKFSAALERAQAAAQKAGNLDDAFAIKKEREAVLSGKYLMPQDDDKTPTSLKAIRATYRASLAKLEAESDKALRPLKDAYARSLDTLITTLTRGGRLEEAMTLKKVREDMLSSTAATVAAATNDLTGKSFTNSLGMKFVQVPGTQVLFCIHETRYKDYAAYAADGQNIDGAWKSRRGDEPFVMDRPEEHPVARVSWDDAQGFCAWLSKKEGRTYRLPTDREWSYAVGIGQEEKWEKDTTPATIFKNETDFPWGTQWPPPAGAGNYSDESRKAKAPANNSQYFEDYDDGFPTTAPVMSFKSNKLGIYDLGGNVWEWCEDWYDSAKTDRVLRGSSWTHNERGNLLSSCRDRHKPNERLNLGFRIVLVPSP